MNTNFGPIFDFHAHLLGNELDSEFLSFAREWNTPFAVSCLGPDGRMLAGPTVEECRRANDKVLELARLYPELVHGFCYLNPLHGNQALDEMKRCIVENRMVGVKLWIACRCSDERVFPIIEEALSLGVPVLQHAFLRLDANLPGETNPGDIAALAGRYSEAKLVMAHMGFRWKEGVDVVKEFPNVYVDTSGTDPETGSIEYAVNQLGADRVLYGSDAPGRDVLCQLGKVIAADVSPDDRKKMLYSNAGRLLRLS